MTEARIPSSPPGGTRSASAGSVEAWTRGVIGFVDGPGRVIALLGITLMFVRVFLN